MAKMVLNSNWGGFRVPDGFEIPEGVSRYEFPRDDAALVEYVETHADECRDLRVVTLPDNITDWMLNDYDGLETVYYVVNGKIHSA